MNKKSTKLVDGHLYHTKRTKSWKKVVSLLACVVVFCTTYALILPAITMEGQAYCGQEEHKHVDSCYVTDLICQIENVDLAEGGQQTEDHTHSEECYEKEVLICNLEENTSDEITEESVEVHRHDTNCYETGLSCTLKEHSHGLSCYSNSQADIEKAEDWEKTLPTDLTGIWADDVIKVAESQLGYKESSENYVVDGGDDTRGYTRYGEWYGDPYGHWCAMFASFCLDYAGVENYPLSSNCQSWIDRLTALGLYQTVESYIPEKGDLIFFQWDSDAASDHVGLVVEVTGTTVKTIEGNAGDKVCCKNYSLNNEKIMGYGRLQGQTENSLTYKDDEIEVKAVFGAGYEVPKNAVLTVDKITQEENEARYNGMLDSVQAVMEDESHYVREIEFYDFHMYVDGIETEIPDDVTTQVVVQYEKPLYTARDMEMAADFAVLEINQAENSQTSTYNVRRETSSNSTYSAEAKEAEFEQVEEGIKSVSFVSEGLDTIAFTMSRQQISGTYWRRLNGLEDEKQNDLINVGDTLMIVSADGNMAVSYGTNITKNKAFVDLRPVPGNEDYFYDDVTTVSEFIVESKNDSSFVLKHADADRYLIPGSGTVIQQKKNNNNDNFVSFAQVNRDDTQRAYAVPKIVWNLSAGTYSLATGGPELSSNGITGILSSSNSLTRSKQDFLVFKLETTALDIPKNYGVDLFPDEPKYDVKPNYDAYHIDVSGAKEDSTTMEELPGLSLGYVSDAATSNIEAEFGTVSEDGKLLTDKSVVYGDDDYNAFSTYREDAFGVTLSALGQVSSDESGLLPNLDVVIILDTSYSMLNINYGTMINNVKTERMKWALEALNNVIDQIMENSQNRIGLVTFSDAAQTVLPLDHYTIPANAGDFINASYNAVSGDVHNRTQLCSITVNSQVRNSDNQAVSFELDSGQNRPNWEGTFTQTGIQEAGKVFFNASTTKDDNGNTRQPVFVLISDGGPTLCSSNYQSPQEGPVFGNSGNQTDEGDTDYIPGKEAEKKNSYGVNGYYTILTANYYKDMVGSHYGLVPRFASIGIGISDSETQNEVLHDNTYCQAVLNPSEDFLTKATATSSTKNKNTAICGQQLKDLLENKITQDYIKIPNHREGFNTYTATYSAVPVLQNPYANDFDYADVYYDGKNTSLANDLMTYLNSLRHQSYSWSRVINPTSSVEIEDPIGEYMEVLSAPILRFGGQNYSALNTEAFTEQDGTEVVKYIYDYEVAHDVAYPLNINANNKLNPVDYTSKIIYDLSEVEVTVSTKTEQNGKKLQTVKMVVPENILPYFYPETFRTFYYREQPIRLIFQVGLSQQGFDDAKKVEEGETRVYYTNRFAGATTTAAFEPDTENEYDFNMSPKQKVNSKTGTIGTSFTSSGTGKVTQKLGNNGKLAISRELTSVTVKKQWTDSGSHNPVYVHLYEVKDGTGAVEKGSAVLSSENGWTYTWEDLPKYKADGTTLITYKVSEEYVAGYASQIIEPGETYSSQGWTEATTITSGSKYVLVSQSSNKLLLSNGNDGFAWDSNGFDTTSSSVNSLALWTSEGVYWKDKNNKYMYCSTYSSNIRLDASTSKRNVQYIDNTLRYVDGSNYYYFSGIGSDAKGTFVSANNNSIPSNALRFTAYEWTDVQVIAPENTFIILNSPSSTAPASFYLNKTNLTGQALEGAVFALYKESNEDLVVPIPNTISVQTGVPKYGILLRSNISEDEINGTKNVAMPGENGTYYLVEVEPPDGFEKLRKPIVITVSNKNIASASNEDNMAAYDIYTQTVTVRNKAAYEIPETGGMGTYPYMISGILLMTVAAFIYKKKYLRKEET